MRALDDIRILDLTHVYNGPYATLLLGFFGAEIIKVEPPRGEMARTILKIPHTDESHAFIMLNSNKKGITLNLKSQRGRELLKELASHSDVIVENFAAGVMDKLGLGYEDLRILNPGLIYASGSGFGRSGPYSNYPAFDPIVQAMTGLMNSTGFPENPPVKAGPPIFDIMTGTHLCAGILAAIHQRDRTGEGTIVETNLFEASLGPLITQMSAYRVRGLNGRFGNTAPGRLFAPYNTFKTKDGYVLLLVANDEKWQALCKVMQREDLLHDPQYATNAARVKRFDEVDALIAGWTSQHTKQQVMELLTGVDVTCGIVKEIPEVLEDPHLRERGTLQDIEHPTAGKVTVLASPIRLNDDEPTIDSPSPRLGEHNDLIYGKLLGLSTKEIASLREQGII
jgi:CoA:oxalate CoA-transferase